MFNCNLCAIGSFPQKDYTEASVLIKKYFSRIPLWPQLPKRSFNEEMYVQFSENIPGIRVDREENRISMDINRTKDEEIESFYDRFANNDLEHFAITSDYSNGLYAMISSDEKFEDSIFIKGHITGPVSFALSVLDEEKKPVIYNDEAFNIIVSGLKMKMLWQASILKRYNKPIIIFIDEPYMVNIDSGMLNLNKENIFHSLKEFIDLAEENSILSAIHCCGNTDWGYLMKLRPKIINFDAYNFYKNFNLYTEDIKNYINDGGCIAPGIIPTDKNIMNVSVEELLKIFYDNLILLEKTGIERNKILRNMLITPSCGMGSLDEKISAEICRKSYEVSELIKKQNNLFKY